MPSATERASSEELGTRSSTSRSEDSARASSSARIPIPAIRGRIGSGATTTMRVIPSPAPAQALEPEVQLPRPRAIDLLEKAVQPPDLAMELRNLCRELTVRPGKIGDFLEQPRPLRFQ